MFELMVILFIVGYVFIALEHTVNINKAATALSWHKFMGCIHSWCREHFRSLKSKFQRIHQHTSSSSTTSYI
jgi:hypothetical protein